MGRCSEDKLKCASIKEVEIDIGTVDFTGLGEYDPRVDYIRGGVTL